MTKSNLYVKTSQSSFTFRLIFVERLLNLTASFSMTKLNFYEKSLLQVLFSLTLKTYKTHDAASQNMTASYLTHCNEHWHTCLCIVWRLVIDCLRSAIVLCDVWASVECFSAAFLSLSFSSNIVLFISSISLLLPWSWMTKVRLCGYEYLYVVICRYM